MDSKYIFVSIRVKFEQILVSVLQQNQLLLLMFRPTSGGIRAMIDDRSKALETKLQGIRNQLKNLLAALTLRVCNHMQQLPMYV